MNTKQKSQQGEEDTLLKQLLAQEQKEEKQEFFQEQWELQREEKQKHRRSDRANWKDSTPGGDIPSTFGGNSKGQ